MVRRTVAGGARTRARQVRVAGAVEKVDRAAKAGVVPAKADVAPVKVGAAPAKVDVDLVKADRARAGVAPVKADVAVAAKHRRVIRSNPDAF